MKLKDIHIRDPFILPFDGKYYLYGTRGETAWQTAEGLDVYVSAELLLPGGGSRLQTFNDKRIVFGKKKRTVQRLQK